MYVRIIIYIKYYQLTAYNDTDQDMIAYSDGQICEELYQVIAYISKHDVSFNIIGTLPLI